MAPDRDELAKTATATSASIPATTGEPIGETLGRYRLERVLGAGGMGVVHAAFDPDLERRVALKVLRGGGSDDARKRLLREARAMARLSHPNVITVHEVSSIGGRDYVAMELVDGETLADWLRATRRPQALIFEAFIAAGRGLAAAHAAGLVHRDFKPHNVLRSRSGRIVVTDFGLAREAHVETPASDAFEQTLPSDAQSLPMPKAATTSVGTGSQPSTLAGLTVTGSLLGTPAYMAPEQWASGNVSPATDQFAFSVALWEALAGERPYRGATPEALREEVTRGPAALDASKIPRGFRKTLQRGLDPDPAKRFPSMDAFLRTMKRAERRPFVFLGLGVFAMMTIAVVFGLAIRKPPVTPLVVACPAPALDPAAVWSPQIEQAMIATGRKLEAKQLAADFARWTTARQRACTADPVVGVPRRACLDIVLEHIDATARAVEALGAGWTTDAGNSLVEPSLCELPTIPRLVKPTRLFRDLIATMLGFEIVEDTDEKSVAQLVARVADEPCAAAMARLTLAQVTKSQDTSEQARAAAVQDAERCGDDIVRATVAITIAEHALNTFAPTSESAAKLKLAEAAVQKAPQADLIARLELADAYDLLRQGKRDEVIANAERATVKLASRDRVLAQLSPELTALHQRWARGRPDDLAKLPGELAASRARTVKWTGEKHPAIRTIDGLDASWTWSLGDVEAARAKRERLRREQPNNPARAVSGRVVDASGAPVVGATVIVGEGLNGDSTEAAIFQLATTRAAITTMDGKFSIADAPAQGVAIAQHGDRRSIPLELADSMTFTVEPTSTIRGRVDLAGKNPMEVALVIVDPRVPRGIRYSLGAPIRADGTFEIVGAPRRRIRVYASVLDSGLTSGARSLEVDASKPVVEGVAISMARKGRVVHVIVRNTVGSPLTNAAVRTFEGHVPSQTLAEMQSKFDFTSDKYARQIVGDDVPPTVKAASRRGDLFATLDAPEGDASACAIGMPTDLANNFTSSVAKNMDKVQVRCVPLPAKVDTVVVEVPPWPRLD